MTHNTIPFSLLDEANIEDISQLAIADLLGLQTRLNALFSEVKRHKSILDTALELKFTDKALNYLEADGRDTGTVRFFEEDYSITAELPKKVIWDQNKLAQIISKIPVEEHKQYIKTNYSIDERKYLFWPDTIKNFFSEARSQQIGKPKFSIEEE